MNFLEVIDILISPEAFIEGLFGTWFAQGEGFVGN
jgi:hypothetical protein